jgi:Leucine-rich repeat (LRR) protein
MKAQLRRPHNGRTLVFLVSIIIGHSALAFARIPRSERQALTTLFISTHGENWKSADGWLSSNGKFGQPGTECDWEGVTCDKNQSHVIGLSLSNFELKGVLSSTISHLRELRTLDLSFNQLNGTIPRGLFSLRHLQRLDLSENRLRGSVPLTITPLRQLESLNLAGNYLQGKINGLARFPAVVDMDFSNNRFEGTLPTSIKLLRKVERLALERNALVGPMPPEIGELHSLKALWLSHNRLNDEIPKQLGSLSDLEFIDLSYNQFLGPVPTTMRLLNHLLSFRAKHNVLAGHFPTSVCHDGLTELDLSDNQFDGELPGVIAKCNSLQTLNLANNAFRGNLSLAIFNTMPDLHSLDVSSNQFNGPLPSSIGNLNSLSILNVSDNKLSGDIPHIKWPDLRVLRMDRNGLSGPIPAELLVDSLQELTLSANRLSGELPVQLCALVSLRILDLSHNEFTGDLYNKIDDLEDLNVLNLSHNQLGGTLPASVTHLKNLTKLVLSNNSFTGPLPRAGELPALQVLDVSFNKLAGELPEWVGQLATVRSIQLQNNGFIGGLHHLTKLKHLAVLEIAQNSWSEPIPGDLTRLQNIPSQGVPTALIDPQVFVNSKSSESAIRDEIPEASTKLPEPSIVVREEGRATEEEQATLSGVVRDPTSAAVANVMVTAESTLAKVSTRTDDDGRFTLALTAGKYRLTFGATGFKNASIDLSLKPHTSYTVEVPLGVGFAEEVVEVAAEAPKTARGLWWNSWITRRGTSEDAGVSGLKSGQKYSFYLELSGIPKRNEANGDFSVQLGQALQDRLTDLLSENAENATLFVRVSVIGRAALLSTDVGSAAEWSPTRRWNPTSGSTSAAVLNVDLERLLPPLRGTTSDTNPEQPSSSLAYRGGAVRFGIDAKSRGCAAVAVSIWDETRTVPLDHLVRAVSVDGQEECGIDIGEQQTAQTLYSEAARGLKPDVSLQIFDFTLNGETHSATFMTLENPTPQCESFNWDSDATLVDLVLKNRSFKDDLVRARMTDHLYDNGYSSLGQQITDVLFTSTRSTGPCGSIEALEALKTLARDKDVRMFARISDEDGRLVVAPLGLMAMFEQGKQRIFEHDIHLFQPVARETLSDTACVSGWTFVLPSELEGVNDESILELPKSLANDGRLIRSRDAFVQQFIDLMPDNNNPSGLVLLAHHEDGVLRFSGSGDEVVFTQFQRDLGLGSIVVLSACETGNLTQSTKLVNRLNQKGADALVVALFELPADFGVRFSFNFAQIVAKKENLPITLEDAFKQAVSDTVNEFSRTRGDRARGMGLELVLVGNPKLKICAPNSGSPQPSSLPN